MPNGNKLPVLFDFKQEELMQMSPEEKAEKAPKLIPEWYR